MRLGAAFSSVCVAHTDKNLPVLLAMNLTRKLLVAQVLEHHRVKITP